MEENGTRKTYRPINCLPRRIGKLNIGCKLCEQEAKNFFNFFVFLNFFLNIPQTTQRTTTKLGVHSLGASGKDLRLVGVRYNHSFRTDNFYCLSNQTNLLSFGRGTSSALDLKKKIEHPLRT